MKYRILQNSSGSGVVFFSSLLLLIFLIPFNEGGNGYILQLITQLLFLLCATLWALQVIRRGQILLIFDWIDLFVLGFVAWAGLSLYFSEYKYATILELIKIFSYAALFYLCRIVFPLGEGRTALLVAILSSTMLQLLVSLYSFFIQGTPILQAGFVNPNNLACFFVIGITTSLSLILFYRPESRIVTEAQGSRGAGEQGSRGVEEQRSSFSPSPHLPIPPAPLLLCASVAMICLVIAVLALKSRGALISFFGTGIFLTTLRKRRLGLAFLVIACLLVFFPFPQGSIIQLLRKSGDPFAYQRIDIWKSSLKMISDHPVAGVGLGMYKYYGTAYNFPVENQIARYGKLLDAAHNDTLQIGAEIGLIGFTLFLGGIFLIGYYSVIQLKKRPIPWQIAASSAGILGVLIQGLVSNLLHSPAIAATTVLLGVILLDGAGKYRQKAYTFLPFSRRSLWRMWQWYGGLFLLFIYILVPVIGYPFLSHVYYLKYQKLRQTRDIAKAVEHLQTALKFIPFQAYYHQTLGELYLTAFRNQPNLDAFYEGYKEFTQAIRYNPREPEFYEGLAELHREMYRQKLPTKPTAQNALQEYQRAIQHNPFSPFIRFSQATLYADIGEFDQAIASLRKAVEIEPNFVGGYQMLGKMLNHLQREQEAKEAFEQADRILERYTIEEHHSDYVKSLLRSIE
jgi:tetratricopeptide (TPR) repeat protein